MVQAATGGLCESPLSGPLRHVNWTQRTKEIGNRRGIIERVGNARLGLYVVYYTLMMCLSSPSMNM